jgi:hypothetical protein
METEPTVTTIAEAQAAKDAILMAELQDRAALARADVEREEVALVKRRRISHRERVLDAQNQAIITALQQVPLNRAQRRAQTKAFAAMLRTASQNA